VRELRQHRTDGEVREQPDRGERDGSEQLSAQPREADIKTLKQNNMRAVLQLMRARDLASVAEISGCIRLSKTTIKKIFDHLSTLNLVVSAG